MAERSKAPDPGDSGGISGPSGRGFESLCHHVFQGCLSSSTYFSFPFINVFIPMTHTRKCKWFFTGLLNIHPKCSDKMSIFAQVVWSKCLFLTPAWGVYESQGVQLAVSWFLTLLGNNLSFFTISSTPVQVVHGRQFVDESMVFLGDSYRSCQSIGTESA